MELMTSPGALAERVRDGDELAYAALLRRYRPLLRLHRALGLYAPGLDDDDFAQVVRVAIWDAARTWRPGGADVDGFVHLIAVRRLQAAVRAATRTKHRLLADAVPIDGLVPGTDDRTYAELLAGTADDPAETLAGRETLAVLAAALRSLSPLERAAFDASASGASDYDVQELLGRPTTARWPDGRPRAKTAENALQRARGKLRAALAA